MSASVEGSTGGPWRPRATTSPGHLSEPMAAVEDLGHLPASLRQAIQSALKAGWDNIQWSGGFTALHLAARGGYEDAVRMLLEHRAVLSADRKGLTALDYAVQGGHQEIATLLSSENLKVRRSQDPKMLETVPPSPLSNGHSKAVNGRPAVPSGLPHALRRYCELVSQQGWENITWQRGFTGLHLAAQLGSTEAVRFLLSAGAHDVLAKCDDRYMMRPVDFAQQGGHDHLLPFLEPPPSGQLSGTPEGTHDQLVQRQSGGGMSADPRTEVEEVQSLSQQLATYRAELSERDKQLGVQALLSQELSAHRTELLERDRQLAAQASEADSLSQQLASHCKDLLERDRFISAQAAAHRTELLERDRQMGEQALLSQELAANRADLLERDRQLRQDASLSQQLSEQRFEFSQRDLQLSEQVHKEAASTLYSELGACRSELSDQERQLRREMSVAANVASYRLELSERDQELAAHKAELYELSWEHREEALQTKKLVSELVAYRTELSEQLNKQASVSQQPNGCHTVPNGQGQRVDACCSELGKQSGLLNTRSSELGEQNGQLDDKETSSSSRPRSGTAGEMLRRSLRHENSEALDMLPQLRAEQSERIEGKEDMPHRQNDKSKAKQAEFKTSRTRSLQFRDRISFAEIESREDARAAETRFSVDLTMSDDEDNNTPGRGRMNSQKSEFWDPNAETQIPRDSVFADLTEDLSD